MNINNDKMICKIPEYFKLIHKNQEYHKSILNWKIIESICENLDSKYRIAEQWILLYSSKEHGFSLRTLVELIQKYIPPYIFICQEENGQKFGVFIDDKISFTSHCKGKSSTFLYKIENDQFKVFRYTGKFPYFCFCTKSFMGFGCSDGKFGLILDATLLTGSSYPVSTFNNEILSSSEKFKLTTIEVWGIEI